MYRPSDVLSNLRVCVCVSYSLEPFGAIGCTPSPVDDAGP